MFFYYFMIFLWAVIVIFKCPLKNEYLNSIVNVISNYGILSKKGHIKIKQRFHIIN